MDPVLVFVITLLLITIAGFRYRISPFFTLIGGAILFGLLTGMGPDRLILTITTGLGKVFTAFGIIILCGAVIARVLAGQHQIEEIITDLRRVVTRPFAVSGFSGYLLAVPVTCSITAFVMLTPLLRRLGGDIRRGNALLYCAALGSIISYELVYPTPVVIPLIDAFGNGISPAFFDAVAIPISLLITGGIIWYTSRRGVEPGGAGGEGMECGEPAETSPACPAARFHVRAWAPFIAILLAIPAGFLIGLSHGSLINVIMLAGAATALVLAPSAVRHEGVLSGAKHAGVIIFDICGAGALGSVIVAGGFATLALDRLSSFFPVVAIPFLLAALIETAQGSRVVTALITAEILSGTGIASAIHPIPLILMISAGSCIVSYVTDPYFWLIHRTTGDSPGVVVRRYTIPLAASGIVLYGIALLLQFAVFGGQSL
jgi:GntP family gluconate:H+ symporter